jgi:mono/diheme cytochrome c family protein
MKYGPMVIALTSLISAACFAAEPPTITWTLLLPKPGTSNPDPGKLEFDNACAICHGLGPDRPGTSSLQFKYAGKLPALLEERKDLTPDLVRYYIRHGIAMMPPFRKTELSNEQVDAIARYLAHKR